MNTSTQVHILEDRQTLSHALMSYISELVAQTVAVRQRFNVALSGGSLPDIMALALNQDFSNDDVDWSKWHVFWVDERWVSWQNSESNYGSAKRRFLGYLPIPENQIHAMDTSLPLEDAARNYASILKTELQPDKGQYPQFDLVLLGVGPDGHTASLFPNHPVLDEKVAWVASVRGAPKPPQDRITLTLPVINSARHIAWVASGPGKADIVARILNVTSGSNSLPARRVNPTDGEMRWFIDKIAAAGI